MDNIDLKIMDILQADGRITMKELGLRVGLTSPATIERVKKLEESGIISGYKAIIDISQFGLNIRAFIMVSDRGGQADALIDFARKHENILNCHRITGSFTHMLEVAVADLKGLEELTDKLASLGSVESFVVMSSPVEHKTLVLP